MTIIIITRMNDKTPIQGKGFGFGLGGASYARELTILVVLPFYSLLPGILFRRRVDRSDAEMM